MSRNHEMVFIRYSVNTAVTEGLLKKAHQFHNYAFTKVKFSSHLKESESGWRSESGFKAFFLIRMQKSRKFNVLVRNHKLLSIFFFDWCERNKKHKNKYNFFLSNFLKMESSLCLCKSKSNLARGRGWYTIKNVY